MLLTGCCPVLRLSGNVRWLGRMFVFGNGLMDEKRIQIGAHFLNYSLLEANYPTITIDIGLAVARGGCGSHFHDGCVAGDDDVIYVENEFAGEKLIQTVKGMSEKIGFRFVQARHRMSAGDGPLNVVRNIVKEGAAVAGREISKEFFDVFDRD